MEIFQALTGRMKTLPKRCEATMGFSGPEVSPGTTASGPVVRRREAGRAGSGGDRAAGMPVPLSLRPHKHSVRQAWSWSHQHSLGHS